MSTADKPLSNVKTYFFQPIIDTLCTFLKMVNLCGWENMDALLGLQRRTASAASTDRITQNCNSCAHSREESLHAD